MPRPGRARSISKNVSSILGGGQSAKSSRAVQSLSATGFSADAGSGQRPAGENFRVPRGGGSADPKFSLRQNANHRGVVGAELLFGQAEGEGVLIAGALQFPPQGAIARHAARSGDAAHTGALGGANGFRDQHFHNGGSYAGAQVADFLFIVQDCRVVAQKITNGGFQAAEAEVIAGVVEQRTRKFEGGGIPLLRQSVHFRSGLIGQTNQFAGFIETFAGGIIQRPAQNLVSRFGLDPYQQGVTSTDNEGDVWLELVKDPNPGRIEMSLVMVDAQEGFFQSEGDRLRCFETDQQRDGQARSARGGHGVKLNGPAAQARLRRDRRAGSVFARFLQSRARHWQQIFQMLARGQFGHHAAVFGMKLNLRGDDVTQDAAVAHDSGAGFIAGSFNGQKGHSLNFRTGLVQPVRRLMIAKLRTRQFLRLRLRKVAVPQNGFEQILGARQLRILNAFDEGAVGGVEGFQSARFTFEDQGGLGGVAHGSENVRHNAVFMNNAVAGRVVLGRGQLERAVVNGENALH